LVNFNQGLNLFWGEDAFTANISHKPSFKQHTNTLSVICAQSASINASYNLTISESQTFKH